MYIVNGTLVAVGNDELSATRLITPDEIDREKIERGSAGQLRKPLTIRLPDRKNKISTFRQL